MRLRPITPIVAALRRATRRPACNRHVTKAFALPDRTVTAGRLASKTAGAVELAPLAASVIRPQNHRFFAAGRETMVATAARRTTVDDAMVATLDPSNGARSAAAAAHAWSVGSEKYRRSFISKKQPGAVD